MLICSQCRFENPPSNRFCQVCGSSLPGDDASDAQVVLPSVPAVSSVDGQQNEDLSQVIANESAIASEQPDAVAAEAEQSLVMDAFATIPPVQVDYHQSLKNQLDEASAAQDPIGIADVSQESLDPMTPSSPNLGDKAIPDGLAVAAVSNSDADAVATPSDPPEESWDESTVWTGSDEGSDDDDSPTVVLPMQLARLDSAGASHVGRQRDHNEDNFNIQTEIFTTSGLAGQSFSAKGLYILCDGMGGHSGGEVASAMVVEELKRYFAEHWQEEFPSEEMIRAAIASANQAVYDANESDERLGNGRMGTTLVLVLIEGTQVAFAHVGDSRLYTYSRRQGLIQRTVDHEVGQLEVMRGVDPEIAYGRPESYQLTQALGPKDSDYINPGLESMDLQEDTLFLLCSDGLSDYSLVEDHAEEKVAPLLGSKAVLDQGVSDLVHLANELSGHDNITAVAIRVKVRPDSKALA